MNLTKIATSIIIIGVTVACSNNQKHTTNSVFLPNSTTNDDSWIDTLNLWLDEPIPSPNLAHSKETSQLVKNLLLKVCQRSKLPEWHETQLSWYQQDPSYHHRYIRHSHHTPPTSIPQQGLYGSPMIDLSSQNLNSSCATASLLIALRRHSESLYIDFAQNYISDSGLERMLAILQAASLDADRSVQINFINNQLSDQSLYRLVQYQKSHPNVNFKARSLDSKQFIDALFHTLVTSDVEGISAKNVSIDLSHTSFDYQAKQFSQSLIHNDQLKSLLIQSNNAVSDDTLTLISKTIPYLSTLKQLTLKLPEMPPSALIQMIDSLNLRKASLDILNLSFELPHDFPIATLNALKQEAPLVLILKNSTAEMTDILTLAHPNWVIISKDDQR